MKDEDQLKATPPSIFVGRVGYPKVFAGPILSPQANAELYDSPDKWSGSIEDVLKLRMKVARGMKLVDVRIKNPDRYVLELQEAVASIKSLDVDAKIERKISKFVFDSILKPSGISLKIEDFKLESNPRIPRDVEKVYYDELKAEEAIYYLFKKGFSDYYLQKIFSAGMVGIDRKLVPTKWSITAVHEIISKKLKREIANLPEINDVRLYFYEHFGNRFFVLLYPSEISFELLELWKSSNWIGRDSEGLRDKKKYSPLSGGYYAAKISAFEFLRSIKRKAGVIVIREITPQYNVPLGVWVVEEGVRRSLREKYLRFESCNEALDYVRKIVSTKFKSFKQATFRDFV